MPPPIRPRVLFVDGEPSRLQDLRSALRDELTGWEAEFSVDSTAALQALRGRSFDIVVCDLDLADKAGTTLLAAARDRQPQAVRIAATAAPERSVLALSLAHQLVAKTTDSTELGALLARALYARSLVDRQDLRRLLLGANAMPSIPRLYDEVMRALADPSVSLHAVAATIGRDPAMTAKVLQLANSAFHGTLQPLHSVHDAVLRLGLSTLANVVLAAEIFARLQAQGPAAAALAGILESRALAMSRLLVRWFPTASAERDLLATAGLLHELGNVVMLDLDAAALQRSLRAAEADRGTLRDAQLRELGASHDQITGAVLAAWGLAPDLVDVLACHHDPDRWASGADRCAALHAAEVLVAEPWRLPQLQAAADHGGWRDRLEDWRQLEQQP